MATATGHKHGSSWLLDLSGQRLDDDGIEAACKREMAHRKERHRKPLTLEFQEVDASGNNIGSRGCRALVDVCLLCQDLRVVKLSHNAICDQSAPALCELIRRSPALEQLHLSFNRLTGDGAAKLVAAAQEPARRSAGAGGPRLPFWLRLEQNCVELPRALLQAPADGGDEQSVAASVCEAEDPSKCGPRGCCRQALVHLPYVMRQRNAEE
eukprot:CAMPEP_0176067024 /NCGR_PEP_ID=MMETSP0120_2-20121206/33451_1 /TAXON_ID=160619 /ORGANISM="Kryptoperidinium foliaceum, Strain CCMP 1326" /LENGTH=210 /DNA_ID=CAMNT_0017400635 /DNA_START=72 /DNA_END=701 /DNA_ORIENTATION=+